MIAGSRSITNDEVKYRMPGNTFASNQMRITCLIAAVTLKFMSFRKTDM